MTSTQESAPRIPLTDVVNINRSKLERLMRASYIRSWLEPVSPHTVFPGTLDLDRTFAIPLVIRKTGIFKRPSEAAEEWLNIQSEVYNVPRSRGVVLMLIFPLRFEQSILPHYVAKCQYVDSAHLRIDPERLLGEISTQMHVTPDQSPELEKKYLYSKRFAYMVLTGKISADMPNNLADPIPLSELSEITA